MEENEKSIREECWNLDYALAEWLKERLRYFIDMKESHPSTMTYEEWKGILEEMYSGAKSYCDEPFHNAEKIEKFQNTLNLLSNHITSMWD